MQPPPPGFDSWEAFAEQIGIPPDQHDRLAAAVDAGGAGPRLLFQKVPESKTVKNRVHLDVDAAPDTEYGSLERKVRIKTRAEELATLGASLLGEVDEPSGWCLVLADPEENEFCLR